MNDLPLVSIGWINCNRLFYLKSSVESFLECTKDYSNKELLIVDNASVEEGTKEYLDEKEAQGFKVFRQQQRDPSNEFARGLNIICEESTGDFIVPLQADQQFIIKGGWLQEYVKFYQANLDHIGCIPFDAQRQITNQQHRFSQPVGNDFKFFLDLDKPPILGAADCMYSRKIIEMIYPWNIKNQDHEGGNDSETAMLHKAVDIIKTNNLKLGCFVSAVPVAIAIYTDMRGTNARIRGNKRYGDYWEAKENNKYYKLTDWEEALELSTEPGLLKPYSIEFMAEPIGWSKPLDENGSWLKNPIRIDTAQPGDWVEL